MKLRNLLTLGIVALFATTMSAQVVVNQMPLGSAQEDYFKAYDGVEVGLTGNWKKQGDYQYAEISGTGSTYVSVVATKKIKAIRFLATGNGQNSKFNPALIGFKEAPEAVITNGAIQVVDYAVAPEAVATNDGKPVYENAVWVTIDLDTVDLKAVYISRQWKKITTDPEDTKGANVGANGQTIRLFGFHVVLDGQEMPAIPEGPVVVEDPAITKFTIAGVDAKIDNAKKTITAVLPIGTDIAAALAAAVVEDNQDTLDVVIDAEAMTATLGELVYTLVITVADKPDEPVQPTGNAIFYWQATDESPANGAVVAAQGGTLTVVSSDDAKTVSTESAAYAEGVADDMKATGSKAWKMGGNALSLELRLTEGTFKAGDILYISGYKSWKVSSSAEHSGDIATIETGTSKTDYQVGSATLAADAEVIYLMRAEGTGTGVAAIKITRGGDTPQPATPAITSFTIAGVKATIDNAKKTITAELPYGTDVADALAKAVVEDNQDTLDVKIDPEAMTATLGELVYTLVITVADKPVQPTGDAIFYWQSTGEAPADGAVLTAQGGTITVYAEKAITTESAAYAEGVADDMKAADGAKGLKFGGNAINFQLRLSEGSFKAGDVLYISGYNPWKVSSTAEQTGDIAAELATGTSKTDYQVGSVTLSADAEVIYLMRALGTGTCVAAIKVVRGGAETGIEANELSSLVYADGVIFNPEHVALTVYSVSGAIIATSNTNINLNLVPAGLYIVSDGKNVMKVIR